MEVNTEFEPFDALREPVTPPDEPAPTVKVRAVFVLQVILLVR
jgi:hypothetical protein